MKQPKKPFSLFKKRGKTLHQFVILVLASISYTISFSQTTIYSENFNGGTTYYPASTTTTPWKIKTISGSSSNSWAVFYQAPGQTSKSLNQYVGGTDLAYTVASASNIVIYNDITINATSYNYLELNFKWIAGGETGNVNDHLIPVYSTDGGVNWNDVGSKLANSPSYPTYQTVNNLVLPANGTNFKIGFRWVNNGSVGDGKGPAIDDISIVGYVCSNPTNYTITGGGAICSNSSVAVGLSGSQVGVNYQLKRDGTNVGTTISGTGSAINFPNQSTAGTYTVTASGSGICPLSMTGNKIITLKPIPTSVSAGSPPAAICNGGSANLSGSAVGAISTTNYINETFNGPSLPSGWSATATTVTLGVTSSNNAGGTANEITFGTGSSSSGTNYTSRLTFGPINTTGETNLELSFLTSLLRHGTTGTITANIETSTNGSTWVASSWTKTLSTTNYLANETVSLGSADNVGSATFYISIKVTGRQYYLTRASFDNIVLKSTVNLPVTYSWSGGPISSGATTATPVINPTSTTTYTMTATSGGCDVTSSVLVTVNTVDAGTASSNQTLCVGSTPSALSLTGSSSGTIQWYQSTDNTSFTSISGANSASLPSSTIGSLAVTKYYRAIVTQGTCSATSNSVTITIPTAGNTLSNDGDQATCRVKDGNWIHFYQGGRLLVSLNSVDDLGDVDVTSYIDASPASVVPCDDPSSPATAVLERHWVIERDAISFPISNPILVRLPFDDTELVNLQGVANFNTNTTDNVSGISSLKLSKYAGPNNVDDDASNNCVSSGGNGGTQLFSATSSGNVSSYASGFSTTGKYVEFSVPGFSEFWLHGSSNNSPLPISLSTFDVFCDEMNRVEISWTTQSEVNSEKFIVQKSEDGVNWSDFSSIEANGNSSTEINYSTFDSYKINQTVYYRLKYIGFSGEQEIYEPKAIFCQSSNEFTIFPNPSNGLIGFSIPENESLETLTYTLFNLEGKKMSDTYSIDNKFVSLNVSNYETGIYYLEIKRNGIIYHVLKFVKL